MWVWLALSVGGLAVVGLGLLSLARTKEGREAALAVLPVIVLVLAAVTAIEVLNRAGVMSSEQAVALTESLFIVVAVGAAVAAAVQTRKHH